MAQDPYSAGMLKKNLYVKRTPVTGRVVAVLEGCLENRGLQLISPPSRAVLRHEIHELILTDETEAGPGGKVERIAYLGFFEVAEGGIIRAGDAVIIAGRKVGVIAGYDETHMPNHLNIILKDEQRITGSELGIELGDEIMIKGEE